MQLLNNLASYEHRQYYFQGNDATSFFTGFVNGDYVRGWGLEVVSYTENLAIRLQIDILIRLEVTNFLLFVYLVISLAVIATNTLPFTFIYRKKSS